MAQPAWFMTLSCTDRPGIVAAVTARLFELGANILEANQFEDRLHSHFFMRILFSAPEALSEPSLHSAFTGIAADFGMTLAIRSRERRQRILLLASRSDHCLADLLYRWRTGELEMDVVGIVSNHPRDAFGLLPDIPFHHLPVTADTRPEQEAALLALIRDCGAELVILARYMQVLSNGLAAELTGRCINIHHSFLPSFKGAKPYTQAYERGVKMIGATAHYVTADLDEGPIIAQDVERVTHADLPEALVRKGRDIERRVLARAVRCHLEQRVLVHGSRTIVFSD